MNALPDNAAVIAVGAAVDERNPWLGLASFIEETRAYFYGREDEVAELARRVQRKLLTVLFSQSGLGKTSILRAGLVPRLRTQGTMLALALAGQGRDADAQQVIGPILKFHRQLAARNQGDQQQHVELARALYAQAASLAPLPGFRGVG